MDPQEFIITHQLSPNQYNNLHKFLNISFFKNSLNNDYETKNLIELIQKIKDNNENFIDETIFKHKNETKIYELAQKISKEKNKILSQTILQNNQEIKQLNENFYNLQNSEQSKIKEIKSLQHDINFNGNNYNNQIKNLSEQNKNLIEKINILQKDKHEFAENYSKKEKEKFFHYHDKREKQLEKDIYDLKNTILKKDNKIDELNNIHLDKINELNKNHQDNINIINKEKEQLYQKVSYFSNSQKKGEIGEIFTQDNYVPNGWSSTLKNKTNHSGDHLFHNPKTNNYLCVDSKLYTNNVPSKDVEKLKNDVINTNTDAGIMISHSSGISWDKKTLKSIDFRFISNKPFLFISNANILPHNIIKDFISIIDSLSYSLKDNNKSSLDNTHLQTKISITTQNLNNHIERVISFKNILFKQKNSFIKSNTELINQSDRMINEIRDIIQDLKNDIAFFYNDNLLNDIMLKSPESGFSTNEILLLQQTIRNNSFNYQQNYSDDNISEQNNSDENISNENISDENISDENNSDENISDENNSQQNNSLFFQELFQKPKNYNNINDFKKNMFVIFKYHQKILKGKVFNIKDVNIEIIEEKSLSNITRHINNHEIRILPN